MSDESTEHITLPGGRVIRVVHYGSNDQPAEAAPQARPTPGAIHVCPSCAGELVYPVSWEERVDSHWRLALRCPDCEWRGRGRFDQADVELFDDVLNDGTEALLHALRSFSRANMEADIERLISAIDQDDIEPMDF